MSRFALGFLLWFVGLGHASADQSPAEGATSTDLRAITAPVGSLPGTVYLGVTELGTSGRSDPETGFGIDLKGRAQSDTQVRASLVRGWNPGVTAVYRYGMHAIRGEVEARNPRWTFAAGELMVESDLAGVRTVADGASYQRTSGRILGSAMLAKPKYYAGGWAGHLAQGSIGVSFPSGSVMLVGADLARPTARSSVVVSIPDSSAESEIVHEDLQQLGRLFSREDHLRTGGIEGRLRKGKHSVTALAGTIELVAPSGQRSRGPVGDLRYSFTSRRGAITSRVRRGPPSLPGTQISGDSTTASGRLNVIGPVTVTARGFANESVMFGRQQPTRARGLSGGIEYAKKGAHLQLDANYRESRLVTTRVSRSLTARARWPVGPVLVDANGEYGSADDRGRADRIAAGRMAILYEAEPATFAVSGSYQDYGVLPARFSADVGGSVEWGRAMLEGGAGVSKGQLFGDEIHAWASAELRLPKEFTMLLGLDYDRWMFERSPFLTFVPGPADLAEPWRLTFNLQKAFWLDLPFQR
jgi:hypothetical protein